MTIMLVTYTYSSGEINTNKSFDSLFKVQKTINTRQDSAIKAVQEFEKTYKIKDSLFTNQLTILTAIFSTIVAISIFLIGYLIPRLNNEKYKTELKKLFVEFQSIRDEIKDSQEKTKKLEAKNNFNYSKLMFFSCSDSDNINGKFLWSLRHCKDHFEVYNDPTDTDVTFYLDNAHEYVTKIPKKDYLKEYIDEVNSLTSELMDMYTIEGFKDKLVYIKEEYNKLVWKENEQK